MDQIAWIYFKLEITDFTLFVISRKVFNEEFRSGVRFYVGDRILEIQIKIDNESINQINFDYYATWWRIFMRINLKTSLYSDLSKMGLNIILG